MVLILMANMPRIEAISPSNPGLFLWISHSRYQSFASIYLHPSLLCMIFAKYIIFEFFPLYFSCFYIQISTFLDIHGLKNKNALGKGILVLTTTYSPSSRYAAGVPAHLLIWMDCLDFIPVFNEIKLDFYVYQPPFGLITCPVI